MNRQWSVAVFAAVAGAAFFPLAVLAAQEPPVPPGVEKETMFDLLLKGGPVMIPLGIASIVALAIAIERFISLQRERILPPNFVPGLKEAWAADTDGKAAQQYCESSGSVAGHVFKAGVAWRPIGYEAVGKAIEDAGGREGDKLRSSLRGLAVIATISPLLGLLGTVYGMIDAFQHTSTDSAGYGKPADLATGIYEALVTTAVGLTIAIPVLLLYQYLSARVDKMITFIGEAGTDFVASCAGQDTSSDAGASTPVSGA